MSKWVLSAEEQALLRPALDPYHNPLVMPLEEFVRHPIAQELLHNGQTFQVRTAAGQGLQWVGSGFKAQKSDCGCCRV